MKNFNIKNYFYHTKYNSFCQLVNNGFIIQYAYKITTYANPVTITFPLTFQIIPFVCTHSGDGAYQVADNSYVGNCARNKTITSFQTNANGCTPNWSWMACGY